MIGISYIGDYLVQGSQIDKCKKSTDLEIKNTEFTIKDNRKDTSFDKITSYYSDNIYIHFNAINNNQSNLKTTKEIILSLLKYNIKMITIDASTLSYDTFEWSTIGEQQNYIKNMAKALASLVSNNTILAIENPDLDKNEKIFGSTIKNLSDLLVYTKKILVEEYDFPKDKVNDYVGISLNLGNLVKSNDIVNINEWFKIFYNDIKCIKVRNLVNNLSLLDNILNIVLENSLNIPILLELDNELEEIKSEYNKFEFLINKKMKNEVISFEGYKGIKKKNNNDIINDDFNLVKENGFTNIVVILIIVFTVITALLMLMVELKH